MNDEKDSDSNDKILQEIYISHEEDKMPVLPDLFGVWAGSGREVWRFKGKSACYLEDFEV